MKKPRKSYGRRFIFPSFFFIISLCILASFNEFRYDNFLQFGLCAFTLQKAPNMSVLENLLSTNSPPNYDIKILVGILTLPDQYQKRHFLRLIYGTQSPSGAKVDVKFVFCNRTKEDQRTLVALEIMRYDDIIILNCPENMNNGKTYTYFSSLPELFNSSSNHQPYDYVMKADDDIYIRLDNLVESLRPLPKEDLYYGFVIPCNSMDPFVHYMSGMAYLVSWDIVEWIRRSDVPRNHRQGPEDKVMGEWLRAGGRGRNRHNAKWSMYNYPDPNSGCSHDFWPDTIAVHLLKNQEKWIKTLGYFNVTQNLKPSKMYHIP
ncbi:glycosyltransferase [Lithospermum erythrorhizon]|uniref:Hexosyltransferase n=1 Tax=Lithospermum erythrorhizon TaxID=34254 RepID=A0AAV3PEF3_LITER